MLRKPIYLGITKMELSTVEDSFDKAWAELKKENYELISLSLNAELRAHKGKHAEISTNGNWVKEGVLYVPNGKNKFLPISPIPDLASKAVQAHKEEGEFYLTKEEIEPYLKNSIDFPEETIEIPTYDLGFEELTIHAFGGEKKAENYGGFLYDEGIEKLLIYAVDKDDVNKHPLPFVRPIWFRGFNEGSTLFSAWGLQYHNRMRGVRKIQQETDQPFLIEPEIRGHLSN